MMRSARWVWVAALALALVGCASRDKPKPTPLAEVKPSIARSVAWQARLGTIGFPLVMAARAQTVVVAANDGSVQALDPATGAARWRASAGDALSAGVGFDGRFSSVVTRANVLVVFDQGTEVWRKTLGARVVTAPLVAGERVFVLRVDRVVQAFDALDGRELWTLARPGDPLTLDQVGALLPYRDALLAGQGPKLAAIDPVQGTLRWEAPVAIPRGTNEVERLADLVGPASRVGDRVCARAFQSAVGCVDAASMRTLWSHRSSGAQAVGANADIVVGADASGRVSAWRAADGEPLWTNDTLRYRELSGVSLDGAAAVVGDFEGQVHFLSLADGQVLLRMPTDGSAVIGKPLLVGSTLLVATRAGGLFAFRP